MRLYYFSYTKILREQAVAFTFFIAKLFLIYALCSSATMHILHVSLNSPPRAKGLLKAIEPREASSCL